MGHVSQLETIFIKLAVLRSGYEDAASVQLLSLHVSQTVADTPVFCSFDSCRFKKGPGRRAGGRFRLLVATGRRGRRRFDGARVMGEELEREIGRGEVAKRVWWKEASAMMKNLLRGGESDLLQETRLRVL